MARYIVTSDSYFTPFTYDELAKPLQQMTEAQLATQDAYDTLNLSTEGLDAYINKETDPQTRQKYDAYRKNLRALQDELWNNGYTTASRRQLSVARNGYLNDITKISDKIKQRQELSKAYWETAHKDPDTVMGFDPGRLSLDEYMRNENAGMDWFSYSGKQFMQEVAADAAARASEFDDVSYSKDVPGYITRIRREGFSNDDVNKAIAAVRNGTVSDLSGAERILADVLVDHINSTGARLGVNISPEQYNRFIDYGGTGLASTVGKKTYTDMNDVVFRQRLEDSSWAWRNSVTRAQALEDAERERQTKLELEKIKQGGSANSSFDDTITRKGAGENYLKARKQVANDVGGKLASLVFTKNGQRISSNAEASALVYGEDIRREAYKKFGWDIGVTIKGPSDKMPVGQIMIGNQQMFTKYDKHKGVVVSSDGVHWAADENMNKLYNDYRKRYEDRVKYYKNNERDIYRLALTDPDKQREMYEREGLNFGNTSLTGYADAVMSKPGNEREDVWTASKVATRGTDKGEYIGAIASRIYSNLDKNRSGVVKHRQDDWRRDFNTGGGIHEISSTGRISEKPVADPHTVFKIDNDKGLITNIDQITVDESGIRNGYVIVHLSDKNKLYSVSVDMLGSDRLSAYFAELANDLENIDRYDSGLDAKDRRERINAVVNSASRGIRSGIYNEGTIGSPGTSKENEN